MVAQGPAVLTVPLEQARAPALGSGVSSTDEGSAQTIVSRRSVEEMMPM
jgi:hypothetical protein